MVMTGRELRPRSSKPSEASEIQSAKAELVRFLSGSRVQVSYPCQGEAQKEIMPDYAR